MKKWESIRGLSVEADNPFRAYPRLTPGCQADFFVCLPPSGGKQKLAKVSLIYGSESSLK